ncbi:CopG family ribbon-helix-helix protein [Halarchaeum nitratireducens]|uniref:Uncharacterized protein n=1 Tax=Halarchaeum nitratireducens TaxID=489913 RepID=A0A830GG39_9EURY|nr:ribbon-helix-helix domain-containing protein [Halarchaeum nitratireducens]GGN27013.1 hypothetical protein GCM10009021_31930 [Halarchaeum nitratireducens]
MEPNTLRLPAETWEELDAEAGEYGYRNRSEYVRNLIENRQVILDEHELNTPSGECVQSEHGLEDVADLVERVAELEERLNDLDAEPTRREDQEPRDATDSAQSDTSQETRTTTRRQTARQSEAQESEEPPQDGVYDPASEFDDTSGDVEEAEEPDELVQAFRRSLESRNPQKRHAKDAIATVFTIVRDRGPISTGDLKSELYAEYGDRYANEKGMWESLRRYLEEMPGIENAGYGEWGYEGDDAVRDALNQ